MRLTQLSLIATTSLFLASTAFAKCQKPEPPEIPDGTQANEETMVQGQQEVKQYLQKGDKYLKCLKQEDKAAMAKAKEAGVEPDSDKAKKLQAKAKARLEEHNATVDSMHKIGNRFNEEVKRFKAANQ